MAIEALEGATASADALARIPDAASDELTVDLGILGRDYLALQQVRAPKHTGELAAELAVQVLASQLRVRIGLIGPKVDAFYGRFIEFGRSAQTVLVQRRRRVNGRLRSARGRKRAEDIVATYRLDVKARAPQPFIAVPDADLDAIVARRLADFWGRTFARAGV